MSKSAESKFIVVGDHNLNLCSAAEFTGKFIKYYVSMIESSDEDREPESEIRVDAFQVMMSASRNLPLVQLYETGRTSCTMTSSFVQTSSLCWRSSEVSSGMLGACRRCEMRYGISMECMTH